MTTFKLRPEQLSALGRGEILEFIGGPTVKIMLTASAIEFINEEKKDCCKNCG